MKRRGFRKKSGSKILIYVFHKQDSVSINQTVRMEIRLQERRALVQDYCTRHKRHGTVFGNNLRYFLVFRSRKVIYCFIPKIASKQWKKELSVLEEEDDQIYGKVNDSFKNDLNHFSREEVEKMLKNYFTFLFVRDPMERVLSAYKDKFLKENKAFHRAIGRRIVKQYRSNATQQALEKGSDVTFPEFTNFVVDSHRRLDEHWAPFDKLCHPCAVNYDFIGRYEDLGEDAPYLTQKTGIDDLVSFPPFRASNTTAEMLHYYSQIPKARILQIAKIYESDYEMFGYPFPGQLEALFNSSYS